MVTTTSSATISIFFEVSNFNSSALRQIKNYNFLLLSIESRLSSFSQKNYNSRITALKEILENFNSRSSIPTGYDVYTKSNLNFERFREILFLLGINDSEFKLNEQLIDEMLLKKRNHIAHGEYITEDIEELKTIYDKIIIVIDLLSNKILENAENKSYMIKDEICTKFITNQ